MPEIRTPAKINLGLRVLRRRADGYHDIESILLPVPWHDRLAAEAADEIDLTCSDPGLPTGENNLCVAAANALAQSAGVPAKRMRNSARLAGGASPDGAGARPGARMHLEKHIPYGAGLGGGSSDAAAALVLLNHLWEMDLSADGLRGVAAELGADVPFFIPERAGIRDRAATGNAADPGEPLSALRPSPAYVTGRGDQLQVLQVSSGNSDESLAENAAGSPQATTETYRLPFALVVVVPPVEISTAEAYQLVEPSEDRRPPLPDIVRSNDLTVWREHLVNDFQKPIFAKHPAIENACIALRNAGAEFTSLSGSGSAVYGCFTDDARAGAAAESARHNGLRAWLGLP